MSSLIINISIINKYYYLKPTDTPTPRFCGQLKYTSQKLT